MKSTSMLEEVLLKSNLKLMGTNCLYPLQNRPFLNDTQVFNTRRGSWCQNSLSLKDVLYDCTGFKPVRNMWRKQASILISGVLGIVILPSVLKVQIICV